jgi:hypothetical protein
VFIDRLQERLLEPTMEAAGIEPTPEAVHEV